MALPRKLKNFMLFNSGLAYQGEVPELVLPKLTRKTEDYRGGGMNGPVKSDMGMEALEMDWTAAGYLVDVLKQWGAIRHDGVMLRFAGALQADDAEAVIPIEVVVRGRHTEVDFGTAKAGEKTEIKIKTAISYYKLTVEGATVIEIDFVNMVEIVDGNDLMEAVRAAIGL